MLYIFLFFKIIASIFGIKTQLAKYFLILFIHLKDKKKNKGTKHTHTTPKADDQPPEKESTFF